MAYMQTRFSMPDVRGKRKTLLNEDFTFDPNNLNSPAQQTPSPTQFGMGGIERKNRMARRDTLAPLRRPTLLGLAM